MLLILDDGSMGIGPEPSGGVVIRLTHEKLPCAIIYPMNKDQATEFHKALGSLISGVVPATPKDIANLRRAPLG